MRLVSLEANKPSFHSISFNKTGLSLIVGKRRDLKKDSPDIRKTYNGVGKSLIVDLVHFCLGSEKKATYASQLPGWAFTLTFEHDGSIYQASRSTSEQDELVLNGETLKARAYCQALAEIVFPRLSSKSPLSFRSLIKQFIRPNKSGYSYFNILDDREQPYQCLMRSVFLLGLETEHVVRKHNIKLEIDRVKDLKKNIAKDTVLRAFFGENKNLDIELQDLNDKCRTLEEQIKNFQVADNYHAVKEEAEAINRTLHRIRNEETVLINAIKGIEASMQEQPDLTPTIISNIYSEAKLNFPDAVKRTIEEVHAFHRSLLTNRVQRLNGEKILLENNLHSARAKMQDLRQQYDEKVQFLGSHGAFDELVVLTSTLNESKNRVAKLQDYRILQEKYDSEIQKHNAALIQENIRSGEYLKTANSIIESNLQAFRAFSRQFYSDKPGGITVQLNDGENQIRYDITVKIQDDRSDGINEVKIFCYDMTILQQYHNHKVDFLFHDSRLFSDMDARQRTTLFKIASVPSLSRGMQYIASINQDQIEAMRAHMTSEEFKSVFEGPNVVLELADQSPEDKLLGIQVELD